MLRNLNPFAVFLVVAALCLGGTFAYRYYDAQLAKKGPAEPNLVRVSIPDIMVDLSGGARRAHAKVGMSLVVPEKNAVLSDEEVADIVDLYTVFLRTLGRRDLEGSAATARLETELIRRADLVIGQAVVRDVLFRTLLVQ